MSIFKIKCTCGQVIESTISLAGKTIRCRNCERAIQIEENKEGGLVAIALGPEISLPDYVRKSNEDMLAGIVAVPDKICLECGEINDVDAKACAACGMPWHEETDENGVDMQVTDDEKSDSDLDSVNIEQEEEEIEQAVSKSQTFDLVDYEMPTETKQAPPRIRPLRRRRKSTRMFNSRRIRKTSGKFRRLKRKR